MQQILIYIIPFLIASDAFFLSISGGVTIRPFKALLALKIASVFTLCLSIASLAGLFLASAIYLLIESFAAMVGYILLAFVALRLFNDARKIKNEERTFLLEDNKILWSTALASSFLVFLAFFGLTFIQSDWGSLISMAASTFFLSFLGVFFGSNYQPLRLGRSSKFASGILIFILLIIHYFIQ